ncbi:hypothetical protein PV327_008409 [Microctonus hyperodae]|uniref:Ensconsin n=1 Tax=Microctonus hyperodae TaxID=165561 RepID=A0AA39F331_MICHY|nr:hypothetical protein PV327_008409 [Microctonus hyperodae]
MRMSLSMYEVFNWNSSLDPSITNAKNKRASLSLPPTTDIFAIDDKSDNDTRRATMQRATSGDESDAAPGTPSSIYLRVNRRRTDLMPTIPSPRDGPPTSGRSSSAKTFTRSPGRTYSMSRLDQLAQPRKPRIGELTTLTEQQQHQQHHHNNHHDRQTSQTLGASSMSRSMSHLAAPGSIKTLKRSDNSRSMGTLPGAVHLPRPTRAERLRRKAREQHQQQQQQQSQDLLSDVKTKDSSKPPLPKVHTTPKKPSSSATPRLSTGDTTTLTRKSSDRLIKSAKASPRITPKATPLQSPGAEQPLISLIRQNTTEIIKNDDSIGKEMKESTVIDDKYEEKKDQGNEKCHDINETNNATISEIISTSPPISTSNEKIVKEDVTRTITPITQLLSKDDSDKKSSPEADADIEEVVDMSASMIAKIRITTEEEAKAALAERRRFAREQAEREAELERQRLEEEARQEEERLRAEEEEQRRFEEETIRLANEAKEAEEQRLQLAIEDARRREEEDRKRREEEAKQKLEKEEADRKAREEAEKQRLEMVERLKKEEEERIARRKRVEAIMKRTRGNSQANTPTKGDGGDGDKSKDDSPIEESKPVPGNNKVDDVMTTSLISEATQQFINAEQQDNIHHTINNSPIDIVRNGTTHTNGINNDINKATLLENNQGNGDDGEFNGHHTNHGNGINTQSITLDNATM